MVSDRHAVAARHEDGAGELYDIAVGARSRYGSRRLSDRSQRSAVPSRPEARGRAAARTADRHGALDGDADLRSAGDCWRATRRRRSPTRVRRGAPAFAAGCAGRLHRARAKRRDRHRPRRPGASDRRPRPRRPPAGSPASRAGSSHRVADEQDRPARPAPTDSILPRHLAWNDRRRPPHLVHQ